MKSVAEKFSRSGSVKQVFGGNEHELTDREYVGLVATVSQELLNIAEARGMTDLQVILELLSRTAGHMAADKKPQVD